jgi:uroporphyrinogen-III synthase
MVMNRRIILTAPEIYSAALSESFLNAGFTNLVISPAIENHPVDNPIFKLLFENLNDFDFIILPSRNAIDAFLTRAKKYNISLSELKKIKYATIGKDADYLVKSGLQNQLNTSEPSTTGIYNALRKIAGIKKLAVLTPLVKETTEPDIIPDFIKRLKTIAETVRIDAYVTQPTHNFSKAILAKIERRDYNLIAFTSGGEIEAIRKIIDNDAVFYQLKAACFGPFTASTANKNGLAPVLVGTNFGSFGGFAEAIKSWCNNHPQTC